MNKMIKKNLWLSRCAVWVILCLAVPVISQAETYTYDVTGRLTRVIYEDNSSIDYTYDAAGNRLNLIVKGPDADNDGLPDDFEQAIIDANLSDNIEDLDDVLPKDDFDGDGYSNLRELFSESSAVDHLNIPGCAADSSNDGDVDGLDISNMANAYETADCTNNGTCNCDFDNDGDIDNIDLLFLSEDFGRTDCQL